MPPFYTTKTMPLLHGCPLQREQQVALLLCQPENALFPPGWCSFSEGMFTKCTGPGLQPVRGDEGRWHPLQPPQLHRCQPKEKPCQGTCWRGFLPLRTPCRPFLGKQQWFGSWHFPAESGMVTVLPWMHLQGMIKQTSWPRLPQNPVLGHFNLCISVSLNLYQYKYLSTAGWTSPHSYFLGTTITPQSSILSSQAEEGKKKIYQVKIK